MAILFSHRIGFDIGNTLYAESIAIFADSSVAVSFPHTSNAHVAAEFEEEHQSTFYSRNLIGVCQLVVENL
jgi:hypothetical protein